MTDHPAVSGIQALEGLKSNRFRVRAASVNALAQLGEPFAESIIGMLADQYPQVRGAAIKALEKLQPTGEWRKHLRYECYVPAGKFIMGDNNGDANEKPAHEVYVDAFYIGKYPVTNAEYKRYMDDTGQPGDIPTGKADHPVMSVTWHEACDYGRWADMRLLTEAEWEKAASWQDAGSKKRKYPWGDTFDKNKCNTSESGIGTTMPVGKFSPQGDSPYGCADMGGNLWEWTSSLYRDYPYRADDGREDTSSSDRRAVRGGSFNSSGNEARASFRSRGPSLVWNDVGIRCGWTAARYTLEPSTQVPEYEPVRARLQDGGPRSANCWAAGRKKSPASLLDQEGACLYNSNAIFEWRGGPMQRSASANGQRNDTTQPEAGHSSPAFL